jgi:hypothetical protein
VLAALNAGDGEAALARYDELDAASAQVLEVLGRLADALGTCQRAA